MSSQQDVRLTRRDGGWKVDFLQNVGGRHAKSCSISSLDENRKVGGIEYENKNTVTFRATSASVLVEEKYFPMTRFGPQTNMSVRFVGCRFLLIKSDMRMVRNVAIMFDNGQTEGRVIEWHIQPSEALDLASGEVKTQYLQPKLLNLVQNKNDLPAMNVLRLSIKDVSKVNTDNVVDQITAITGGYLEKPLNEIAEEWGKKQTDALNAEHESAEDERSQLRRNRVAVRISSPGQYQQWAGNMIYAFVSPQAGENWGLMIGDKIRLDASTIFIANHAIKDAEDIEAWTATIVSAGNEFLAIANNSTTSAQKNNMYGQTVKKVTITAIDANPVRDRMHNAIQNALGAFAYERGDMSSNEAAGRPRCRLQVPLSASCLDHTSLKLNNKSDRPLNVKGAFEWEPQWGLLKTNKEFITKVIKGAGGKAHLWGPPGTGKTTLLAKTTGFALKHIELDGKIVLSAHSNAATHVLLEACIRELPKFGLIPEDEICWHETRGARKRRLNPVLGREVSSRLEAYNTSNLIFTTASAEPVKYALYLHYRDKMEILQNATLSDVQKFYTQIEMLKNVIKEKYRVFVCTISACTSKFFDESFLQTPTRWKCDILILDELSQCRTPDYLEARQVYDPRRVIEAGDPKQLTPVTHTETAKHCYIDSPIVRAVKMGDRPLVMLTDQFRMPNELYYGTSLTHYEGKVFQHSSVNGKFDQFLDAFKRIEIDPKGDGRWCKISNRFLWLDLDAPMARYGTSYVNFHENAVVERFLRAAANAGIAWSDMCHVVCYEGAYQQGLNMRRAIGAPALAVRKVDSMQGDEFPVVTLSLTKNNEEDGSHHMGRVDSTFRQNVMTSRQQAGLVIVGSMHVAKSSKIWKIYIENVEDNYRSIRRQWCFSIGKDCRFRVNGLIFTGDNSERIDAHEIRGREIVLQARGITPGPYFGQSGSLSILADSRSCSASQATGSAPSQQLRIDGPSKLEAKQPKIQLSHGISYGDFCVAILRRCREIMTDQEVLEAAVEHGEFDDFDHEKPSAELAEEEEAHRIEAEDDARYQAEQAEAAEKERVRAAAESEILKQIADLHAKLEGIRRAK